MIGLRISDEALNNIIIRLRTAGCVFAEDEANLLISQAKNADELMNMVNRRVAGVPLEQVVGWAEFCGLRVIVSSGVFVPRRRTEFLVHEAAAVTQPGAVVVDLCCGSGAVGAALHAAVHNIELYAVDIDPVAVRCARHNIGNNGHVYEGDLYAPLPAELQGNVDVLVVNAPYVPTKDIRLLPQEARVHEPHAALDGGTDGLDVQRRIADAAPLWLSPGGRLLIETSKRQAEQTVDIFKRIGLSTTVVSSEDLDATIVIGTKPI